MSYFLTQNGLLQNKPVSNSLKSNRPQTQRFSFSCFRHLPAGITGMCHLVLSTFQDLKNPTQLCPRWLGPFEGPAQTTGERLCTMSTSEIFVLPGDWLFQSKSMVTMVPASLIPVQFNALAVPPTSPSPSKSNQPTHHINTEAELGRPQSN